MKDLFDKADEYYNQIGIKAAVRERPYIFLAFTLSIIFLIVSIFFLLVEDSILQPISWRDFFKSLWGKIYLISLSGVLIFYYILDRSRPRRLAKKKELIEKLFEPAELTIELLKQLNELFEIYKAYNVFPRSNFFLNFEKSIRYVASIIFAAVLSYQFKTKGLNIINDVNFIALLFICILFLSYYLTFRDFIPYWFKLAKRLIKSSEERIELLLSDMSMVIAITDDIHIDNNNDNKIKKHIDKKNNFIEHEVIIEYDKNNKSKIRFKLTSGST